MRSGWPTFLTPLWLLAVVAMVWSLSLTSAAIAEAVATDDFLIATDDLRLQRPAHFVLNGKPFSWNNSLLKPALEKFPQVTACLRADAQANGQYDLRHFDWEAFRSKNELELCLYFVTKFFDGSPGMRRWFLTQNTRVQGTSYNAGITGNRLPVLTDRAWFNDYVTDPDKCSFLNMFVWPFIWPENPDNWRVRQRYHSVKLSYSRDAALFSIQAASGSCLN